MTIVLFFLRTFAPSLRKFISMSKILNSNFRLKIGRTLYGYSGGIRLLGQVLLHHILSKALRFKKQVFTYVCQKLGLVVKLLQNNYGC